MCSPTLLILLFFISGFKVAQDFCQYPVRITFSVASVDLHLACSCCLTFPLLLHYPIVLSVAFPLRRAECSVAHLEICKCQAVTAWWLPSRTYCICSLPASLVLPSPYFAADFQDLCKNLTSNFQVFNVSNIRAKYYGTKQEHHVSLKRESTFFDIKMLAKKRNYLM